MRTAQQETAPQLPEASNPTPNFIDVNSDSESIVVNAPLSEVYHRCLRFEHFPAFVNSISKMDRIDNTHFSCTSFINGEEVQSNVQIITRVPDRRIAWRAASDHFRVGVVSFYPIGGGTKVTVKVRSIVEPVQLTGALRHCLRNFKVYVENDTEGKSPARSHAALCWPCSSLLLYAFLPLVENLPNGGAQVTSHRLARNLTPVQ